MFDPGLVYDDGYKTGYSDGYKAGIRDAIATIKEMALPERPGDAKQSNK